MRTSLPSRVTAAWLTAVCGLVAPVATVAGTAAAAPATAAPPAPAACGDGLLSGAETCDNCPADCHPSTCKTKDRRGVVVELTPPPGYATVGAVTVLLSLRSGVLGLPGEKDAPAATARVHTRHPSAQVFVNDLGYAVRVVVSDRRGLPVGPLVDVDIDACQGATATAMDLSCRVESCASGGGRVRDCSCTARLQ
jgi:hypothetical protein